MLRVHLWYFVSWCLSGEKKDLRELQSAGLDFFYYVRIEKRGRVAQV